MPTPSGTQREYQGFSQKARGRKPKKPVRYRARHKTLGHLKEEDTKHGFMERIRVGESESHTSEPPLVGVFVMGDATDLQTIPLTQNNYRKASGKLEDRIKAQPLRRTRTLPSSSNDTQTSGIGPYSVPRRSRTDVREIRNSRSNPYPPRQFDAIQRVPYNTPCTGVPMPLPNPFVDEQQIAYLVESATQPTFDSTQLAGAEPPVSFLTSWGEPNMAPAPAPVYESSQSFVPEGLPNAFNGGASDWHTSHELDFAYFDPPTASNLGPEYTQNFIPSNGPVEFQMFDPNTQPMTSPAGYQRPLFEYADDATVPLSGFSSQTPMFMMPQQDFDPNLMQPYWPS